MLNWKPKSELPPDGRRVIIWWLHQDYDDNGWVPGMAFGKYIHSLGEWRPEGCNGKFNDDITHWAYLPDGPKS